LIQLFFYVINARVLLTIFLTEHFDLAYFWAWWQVWSKINI